MPSKSGRRYTFSLAAMAKQRLSQLGVPDEEAAGVLAFIQSFTRTFGAMKAEGRLLDLWGRPVRNYPMLNHLLIQGGLDPEYLDYHPPFMRIIQEEHVIRQVINEMQ